MVICTDPECAVELTEISKFCYACGGRVKTPTGAGNANTSIQDTGGGDASDVLSKSIPETDEKDKVSSPQLPNDEEELQYEDAREALAEENDNNGEFLKENQSKIEGNHAKDTLHVSDNQSVPIDSRLASADTEIQVGKDATDEETIIDRERLTLQSTTVEATSANRSDNDESMDRTTESHNHESVDHTANINNDELMDTSDVEYLTTVSGNIHTPDASSNQQEAITKNDKNENWSDEKEHSDHNQDEKSWSVDKGNISTDPPEAMETDNPGPIKRSSNQHNTDENKNKNEGQKVFGAAKAKPNTATASDNEQNKKEQRPDHIADKGKSGSVVSRDEGDSSTDPSGPMEIDSNQTDDPNTVKRPPANNQHNSVNTGENKKTTQGEKVFGRGAIPKSDTVTTGGKAPKSEVSAGTKYKKPDAAEEYKTRSSTNKNRQKKGKTDPITVHFSVIVSPAFDFEETDDSIEIRIGPNWKDTFCVLKQKKLLSSDPLLIMFQGTVEFEKSRLRDNRFVEYKYAVRKKERPSEKDVMYEYIHNSWKSDFFNRKLKIPSSDLSGNEWNQYDGIMHSNPTKKKKSFYSKLKGAFLSFFVGDKHQDYINITNVAFVHMLPTWEGLCCQENKVKGVAEQALFHLDEAHYCFKVQFQKNGFTGPDENLLAEALYTYIEPQLVVLSLKEKVSLKDETEEESVLRIASALAIAHIATKYRLLHLFTDWMLDRLFEAVVPNPKYGETCVEQLISSHYPTMTKQLTQSLLDVCKYNVDDKRLPPNSQWLLAIPMVHFLGGESKPCIPLKLSDNHRTPEWWGISRFNKIKQIFKNRATLQADMPMHTILEWLAPLFKVDYYLPRSLMAVMNLCHLLPAIETNTFPPEVCLGALFFQMQTISYSEVPLSIQLLKRCLDTVHANIMNAALDHNDDNEYSTVIAVIAKDVVIASTRFYRREVLDYITVTLCSVKLFALVIKCFSENAKDETRKQSIEKMFDKVLQCAIGQVRKVLPARIGYMQYTYSTFKLNQEFEPKVWDDLLTIPFGDLSTVWKTNVIEEFKLRVYKLDESCRVDLYGTIGKDWNTDLQAVITESAFEALEILWKKDAYKICNGYTHEAKKYSALFSKLFLVAWPEYSDRYPVLQHTLQWTAFQHYLRMFYESKNSDLLDTYCQERFMQAISLYEEVKKVVFNGEIILRELYLVLENSNSFVEIDKFLCKTAEHRSQEHNKVVQVIQWRQMEVDAFSDRCKLVSGLVAFCDNLKRANLATLKKKSHRNFPDMMFSEFCKPAQFSKEHTSKMEEFEPQVIYFGLSEVFDEMLIKLNKYAKSSVLFRHMWTKFGNKAIQEKQETIGETAILEIEDVQEQVWQPAYNMWKAIFTHVKDGTIKFAELDKTFDLFIDKYEELTKEFELMSEDTSTNWIANRIFQIKQYHRLDTYTTGARVMQDIKDEFELTGDFSDLDILAVGTSDKNKPLDLSKWMLLKLEKY